MALHAPIPSIISEAHDKLMRLDTYDSSSFVRGRSKWTETLWLIVQCLFISSPIPGSAHRRWLLRLFGARIGRGVKIKPRVRVKFPWRLHIGDESWIGEGVWIDNLEHIAIGSHCCLSQEAYLCTGSHDWSKPAFDLIVRPIRVDDCCWIAARCIVGPGVTCGEGSILTLGSAATNSLAPWSIYAGTPAQKIKARPRTIASRAETSIPLRHSA